MSFFDPVSVSGIFETGELTPEGLAMFTGMNTRARKVEPGPAYLGSDEWAAFVNAIYEQPADDMIRLVAADWLDELGEMDRASFIRVSVAACELRKRADREGIELDRLTTVEAIEAQELGRVQLELLGGSGPFTVRQVERGVNAMKWFGTPFAPLGQHFLERGFIDEVRCSVEQWRKFARGLLKRHYVRLVTFSRRRPFDCNLGILQTTPGTRWRWRASDQAREPDTYPEEWAPFMPEEGAPTPAAALVDLSNCAIAWARSEPDDGLEGSEG